MKEISKGESVNYLNDLVSFKFHRSLFVIFSDICREHRDQKSVQYVQNLLLSYKTNESTLGQK